MQTVPFARSSLTISNISYVNWSSATKGLRGRATGLMISNLVSSIGVTYEGEVGAASQIDDGGVDYWQPRTPYLSVVISNLPPTRDIITMESDDTVNTLLFSEPVVDPVLLLVSLGDLSNEVVYTFEQDFTLLSQGAGYWGDGTLLPSEPNVLIGREGHGAIQFKGTFSSLAWRVSGAEDWHGWTLGIPVDPTQNLVVPEGELWVPAVAVLGIAGYSVYRRRRHSVG